MYLYFHLVLNLIFKMKKNLLGYLIQVRDDCIYIYIFYMYHLKGQGHLTRGSRKM